MTGAGGGCQFGSLASGGMRILHTSDWHVGRTFQGHPTYEALRTVLSALTEAVHAHDVDAVLVAGDVFDSAAPSAQAYQLLGSVLTGIREAGAVVVMISGNHDSAARLGFQSEFTASAGIHVLTRPEALDVPVVLTDEHGPVHVFGIPYLEPTLVRHLWPEAAVRNQAESLTLAMDRIRAASVPGVRTLVLAHTFVSSGVGASESEKADAVSAPRDFTQGGVDAVPLMVFDDVTYAALGHLHSRSELARHVRYCGAPLHYSFGEGGRPRGAWLVDLDADGLAEVGWVDLPVPRPLVTLTATLTELLDDPAHTAHEDSWVRAVLTDTARPVDAMRKLQTRFPHCAQLEHRPVLAHDVGPGCYAQRVHARSDEEVTASFLERVRGEGPTPAERDLMAQVIAEHRAREGQA